ncbi:hypothetical protein CDL15_Pgr009345 [Punica granatum]|uniref:Uncharacterized protein n=1 Tax=Punica granatum TaxID=22663 RepID=A0A218XH30_PUNGR|nr:hypothetical protein CDL15_Pgr009345 [Punica granatum]
MGLGLLLGLDGYLYSFGLSYLPISISSLLSSTQLAFTAVFAFLVVRHRRCKVEGESETEGTR